MYKINETKKKGNYTIVTLALRIPMVEWLESKYRLSEFIRDILIKQMTKEKTAIAINSVIKDIEAGNNK